MKAKNFVLNLLSFTLMISICFVFTQCIDNLIPSDSRELFSLHVVPQQMSPTVPGQRCVLLITVEEEGSIHGEAVAVSISAPGAAVTVEPSEITSGEVAEVTLIPDEASVGRTLKVTTVGERRGFTDTKTVDVEVTNAGMGGGRGDDLAAPAAEFRDRFVAWLAENQPNLGITTDTEWVGTVVKPGILIVMHYLFFSEEWEMGLQWHVMIAPHDWARIYLRRRFVEVHPSMAIEISSYSTPGETPHPINPVEYSMGAVDR
jgi:hypothetical protein